MKSRRLSAYVTTFFFVFLFFVCTPCHAHLSVRERIDQIPSEDRERIKHLFQYLIYEEPFAYTLFGTKPLSFTSGVKHFFYDDLFCADYIFCLISDWKIWQKYQHLFPIKNYAFFSAEDSDAFQIYLINLDLCKKKIAENLKLFQKKLRCPDPFEQILQHASAGSDIFFQGLGKSHALLGILLGFGTENSLYFENFYSGEMNFLKHLEFFSTEPALSLSMIRLPEFAACECEETKQLRRDYADQRSKITELYATGDFLEVTLSQLEVFAEVGEAGFLVMN